MTAERYEKYLYRVKPEQARSIGAWVVGISYMQRLGDYLALNTDTINTTHDRINASTKALLNQLRDEEFSAIRSDLDAIEPNSNAHIARWRMGITSKSRQNHLGNTYIVANKEFVLATFYHEDSSAREKIDASSGVTDLIKPEADQFVDFYFSRAAAQLQTSGQEVRLADLIHDTRLDTEYWLGQSA